MKKAISILLLLAALVTTALASSPVEVEQQTIDGVPYITKIFELPPSDLSSPPMAELGSSGTLDDFEQDGFLYTHHTTASEDILTTDTKSVAETQTAETSSKALEEVLRKYPATLAYEQDGYTGTLILDTGSISTEVAGYTTSSRTISATQTYPGMMYQDPSAVPQSTIEDGVTLPLSNISWTVTGASLAGDSLVPTEYTATASYSKKVSSSVATGYVSTALYSGEASKTEVSAIRYTVTYVGTSVAVPDAEPSALPWYVLVRLVAILLLLSGGVAVILIIRSKQGAAVYNLMDEDYICIGRQRLDFQQPVIDLNEFADVLQSSFFSFVLDKSATKKLFGRNLTVTLGDITMTHRVKEADGKYRFNLEVGVEL